MYNPGTLWMGQATNLGTPENVIYSSDKSTFYDMPLETPI